MGHGDTGRFLQEISLSLGTPKEPLCEAAIFLKLWRTMKEESDQSFCSQPMASVCLVQPDRAGYVIKPLVAAAQIAPESALAAALETARLRKIGQVYVNGDPDSIPDPATST